MLNPKHRLYLILGAFVVVLLFLFFGNHAQQGKNARGDFRLPASPLVDNRYRSIDPAFMEFVRNPSVAFTRTKPEASPEDGAEGEKVIRATHKAPPKIKPIETPSNTSNKKSSNKRFIWHSIYPVAD